MSLQPQVIQVIPSASMSSATSWLLTSSGAFTDTQTIVIAGVTFTTVASIGTTPGNVLIGANAAATIVNLAALINSPSTTTSTGVALSTENANKIKSQLQITATATSATVLTLTTGNRSTFTVSETQTNAAWTTLTVSPGIGSIVQGIGSLQFTASGISSGNCVFTVDVSNDGTNWTAYNRLTTNATNTNAQTDTRVASVTLSTNTSSVVTLPDAFAAYRVTATVSVDGTYTCTAFVI